MSNLNLWGVANMDSIKIASLEFNFGGKTYRTVSRIAQIGELVMKVTESGFEISRIVKSYPRQVICTGGKFLTNDGSYVVLEEL